MVRFRAESLRSKLQTWNSRIKQSASNAGWLEVISQYKESKIERFQQLDPSVFPLILKSASALSTTLGRSVHASFIKEGLASVVSIGNSVVDFYMKHGNVDSALCQFCSMKNRDSVSWNIVVFGILDKGYLEEGFRWFSKARFAGLEPNFSTLVLVIKACRTLGAHGEGLQLHGYMIRSGFLAAPSILNSMLSLYVETDMVSARKMFDEMPKNDVVSWSVIIGGYVQSGEARRGMELFKKMFHGSSAEPDGVSAVNALKACAALEDIQSGESIHAIVVRKGFHADSFIGNSLISMYSKCGDAVSAVKVFTKMSTRNTVTWNSMLSGLVCNEKYHEASFLFHCMMEEEIEVDEVSLVNILQVCKFVFQPLHCKSIHCVMLRKAHERNELVLNSLIVAYADFDLVELAWRVFSDMENRDVVSWSTMILALTLCGKPDVAIAVFREMSLVSREKPNAITIVNLLEACSAWANLRIAKWAHGVAIRRDLASDVFVGTAVIDTYSKCGAIKLAERAFDQLTGKNIVTWTAMIAAYGTNGLPDKSLGLLAELKQHGLNPNSVTNLSALSACSHGGLIKEGLDLFRSMAQEGAKLGLEHYSCVVDMLSRAGELNVAIEVVKNLPEGVEAGASAWCAILSGCRSFQNIELVPRAAAEVLELAPACSSGYLLASSIYASGESWEDVLKVRKTVKERGVKVAGGYSLVNVGSKACGFLAGDTAGCLAGQLDPVIEQLHGCMKINEILNQV